MLMSMKQQGFADGVTDFKKKVIVPARRQRFVKHGLTGAKVPPYIYVMECEL